MGDIILIPRNVNSQGEDLSFGSLDKSYLANHSEYREAAMAACFDCFAQLRDKQPNLLNVEVTSAKDCTFEVGIQQKNNAQ